MSQFPGELTELEFTEAYCRAALRKPEMAADAALRALVFAEAGDRAILTGLIAQELAEACRRLVAVHGALADRRLTVARSLLRPLPGAADWVAFVQQAGSLSPEQMLRELSLGDEALASARQLRSQDGLADLTSLVAAAETGSPMLLIPNGRLVADECWLGGVDAGGQPVASSFGAAEADATNLADLVADLSSIARGFLGAYLGYRTSAGRRN